ncbi:MAG: sugar isomerase [Spirochaetales bacterium]|nr:sugar isomerase [Spirochaetales bacterium]
MNSSDKYSKYALCREMLETPDVIRSLNIPDLELYAGALKRAGKAMLTGEGSSRIFPAKRAISESLKAAEPFGFVTEGATQAMDYPLDAYAVFGASNSGRTKELVRLFDKLKKEGHKDLFGVTAASDSTVESYSRSTYVLNCGKEDAVAATKSVAEQALFYDALRAAASGRSLTGLDACADAVEKALTMEIDPEVTSLLAGAGMIYFAGRNNGVAEELTLKTNEITRKKSDFLEGTYGAHGIEEVMSSDDVLVVIDPFEEEEQKFLECLTEGVGIKIISVGTRKSSFAHSVVIPDAGDLQNYVELAAGWNLLVETGLALQIDLDKPVRARKVGNEFIPS